jgi:hypothetical protein
MKFEAHDIEITSPAQAAATCPRYMSYIVVKDSAPNIIVNRWISVESSLEGNYRVGQYHVWNVLFLNEIRVSSTESSGQLISPSLVGS